MKQLLAIIITCSSLALGQCLTPQAAVGIKPGFNFTTYNPDDGGENLSGIGFNIGLGFGVNAGSFGLEIVPSFRSTSYQRTEENINTTLSWHYRNFYLPVRAKLIAALPSVAPFLALGCAFDFQRSGYFMLKVGGSSFRTDIASEDLENDIFLSVALGSDVKLTHFKVTPELAFDYNLTADNEDTENRQESNYDLTFALGLYYTP